MVAALALEEAVERAVLALAAVAGELHLAGVVEVVLGEVVDAGPGGEVVRLGV
ncbi:MAG: hypothetical protein LC775_13580 [Acidobacteria bacterium]|nr:hypothetical protein [Acidobacteriota bacterium]